MVKAEAEKDYYADLELNPSADANEVKKAFMRLGTGCWALAEAMSLYSAPLASTACHGPSIFTLRSYLVPSILSKSTLITFACSSQIPS